MIFDRFYQSEPIPGVTGSGIGLHMVKEYVSLHNGKIEVHSKIGVGTTFLIYIPSDLKGDDSESKAPAMSPDVEEKVVYSTGNYFDSGRQCRIPSFFGGTIDRSI